MCVVDPKKPKDYEDALKMLHRKDGECLKCGKWITGQTLHGSLCQKCNEDFAKFEEQRDLEYMNKHPDTFVILDPKYAEESFLKFIGLDVVTFVLS